MHFLGIDLAWSPRNQSGGAVLSQSGRLLEATSSLGDDDEVLDWVARALPSGAPGLIAVDAPLAVPNERGWRPCDRDLARIFRRFEASPYPANRRALSRYGGLRGEAIRKRLGHLGFRHSPLVPRQAVVRQVVEVFPHPATVALFDLDRSLKYKSRPGRDYPQRWRALARLRDHLRCLSAAEPSLHLTAEVANMALEGLRGRRFKEAEDLLDAVVCAYSALHAWHHGPRGYAIYGGGRSDDHDAEAGHILVPMTPRSWQRIQGQQLLLLDRDGTLNHTLGEHPPNHPHEVELLPGVGRKLQHLASMGWRLVVISNQGGIAFGYQTHQQAWATHRAVLDALPVRVEASYLCPHHPDGTETLYAVDCPNRKPAPGALLNAMARFQAAPQDCLFVGDRDSDYEAAAAAGVAFAWAADFFAPSPALPPATEAH
jgi:histidinol-phosphate phosphatase family protein